jgi:hypothetical protein
MFEDWMKDFPFKQKSFKDYQQDVTKFWRDAYNNFCKLFKHDL